MGGTEHSDWPPASAEVVSRDPRCAITTLDTSTTERGFETLRLNLNYRANLPAVYL